MKLRAAPAARPGRRPGPALAPVLRVGDRRAARLTEARDRRDATHPGQDVTHDVPPAQPSPGPRGRDWGDSDLCLWRQVPSTSGTRK
ncbi:hypothetical protein ACWEPC_39665 [Nonomuraea sp. NPDC004297]